MSENLVTQVAEEQYELAFFGVGSIEPGHLKYGELPARMNTVPADIDTLIAALKNSGLDDLSRLKYKGALGMGLVYEILEEDLAHKPRENGPEGDPKEMTYAAHSWRIMGLLSEMGINDPTVLVTAGLHEYAHNGFYNKDSGTLTDKTAKRIRDKFSGYEQLLGISTDSIIASVERYRHEYERRKQNTETIAGLIFTDEVPAEISRFRDRFLAKKLEANDIVLLRNYIRDSGLYQSMEETMDELAHNFNLINGSPYNGLAVYMTLMAQAIEHNSFPHYKTDDPNQRETKRLRNGIMLLMDLYPIAQLTDLQPMYRQIANKMLDIFYPNEWQKMRQAVKNRAAHQDNAANFFDDSLDRNYQIIENHLWQRIAKYIPYPVHEVDYSHLVWIDDPNAFPENYVAVSPSKKSVASLFLKLLSDLAGEDPKKKLRPDLCEKSITEYLEADFEEIIAKTNDVLRFKIVLSDLLAQDLLTEYNRAGNPLRRLFNQLATDKYNLFTSLRAGTDKTAERLKLREDTSELHLNIQLQAGEQPVEVQFTNYSSFIDALKGRDYHPGYKIKRWFRDPKNGFKGYAKKYQDIRRGVSHILFGI